MAGDRGWEVAFLTQREGPSADDPGGVLQRSPSAGRGHPPLRLRSFEEAVITGQGFARAAVGLDRAGFRPDIVMAHAGWGVGSFLKDVWPETCAIPYFEWYYNWPYPDRTPYDAEAADPLDARARNRIRNAPLWADFSTATAPSARPASRRRSSPSGCATG